MALLFADENFPQPVVEELRRSGADVLTLNRRHFVRLHAAHPEHAGIIVCTLDLDFAGQATRIVAEMQAVGDLHGRLLRVNRPA